MRLAHVLILDDEPDSCNLVKRIVEGLEHTAAAFTDEDAAIGYGASSRVELVILDLKLRRMSGLDVLQRLRQTNPGLKVVILTGYPMLLSAEESSRLRIDQFLFKPVDIDLLEIKISETLAGTETQDVSDECMPHVKPR
jgi:DNA-binding NtrC family response regulator